MQATISSADAELLLALVRGGTLAQAAARLGADASTVFRNLQRIEKQAGQRLFERSRTGYLPGDVALEIARHAERMEAELEAARAALAGPGTAVTGRVRLSTTDAVLRGLVMPQAARLIKAHPLLQLEIRVGNELVSLTRRDADLALRATSKPPEHLIGRHLGTMRFVVAAQASQPARRKTSKYAHLAALTWIAPDDALPEHPSVRWRNRHLPKLRPTYLLDGITAVADAIAAGLGVGIVPGFILKRDARLMALTPELDGCESQLWLLAHPESRHLRRIAAVYQALAEGIRL
jgi:DNA-binding transcriptional LysR family regulator